MTSELKPVAWRVKDFADGWIVFGNEQKAYREAKHMGGALVEPLYRRTISPEELERAAWRQVLLVFEGLNMEPPEGWESEDYKVSCMAETAEILRAIGIEVTE